MRELRIATRASRLALAQARLVATELERARPGIRTTLVEVTTSGDLDQSSPVAELTETGAFVRAVQSAVIDGTADCAVHSCKDMPTAGPEGFETFFPARGPTADVLCGARLVDLAEGARVGTGSPRRTAQLRLLRADLDVRDLRGNVDTRLARVEDRSLEAVVLAQAGLDRLERRASIDQVFTPAEMVPAPAQGAIAIEAPKGEETASIIALLTHAPTQRTVAAERHLLSLTGAGCRSALGAVAVNDRDSIRMLAFVEDERGPRRATVRGADPLEAAERMAKALELIP